MDHEFLITMRLSFSLALITTLILLPIGIFFAYFLAWLGFFSCCFNLATSFSSCSVSNVNLLAIL
ncbi:hypothetical protein HPCPY3281_0508 [Helicobacter pylori CPY3281]|nr:hypothetical protein HPCPY3281_0508 [Helicobacter pylori CPY3281]